MVIEDALTTREMLSRFLVSRGYRTTVVNADEALRRLTNDQPDAIIVNLVGTSGFAMIANIRSIDRDTPVLVVTDAEPYDAIAPEPRAGWAIIVRPFEERQVENALVDALGPNIRPAILPARRVISRHPAATLLGESDAMAEVRDLIERVAESDVTVLIQGESGTGKEVTARALKQASPRRDKAYVKVNCAALPADLLESELFGYEKGAFTGAMTTKPGRFEVADHGTMFLDEIGEMSPLLQAKLLQVLQDGEFSRLGSAGDVRVDVRIIAATNRDLKRAVGEGQFREDLFFRLNVVNIVLPPLREHKEDIPLLTEHFLRQQVDRHPRSSVHLSQETKRLFFEYDWPGNVRELENAVKRLIVLGSDASIQRELREAGERQPDARVVALNPPAAQPDVSPPSPPPATSLKEISRTAAREAERTAILGMLERTRWNRKEAAEILGISYKALLYKIKDNHLDDRN